MAELKIVFTGCVSAGKTAAISTISEIPIITTDVKATDEVASDKETTTIAMDYGEMTLDDGVVMKLYGTPGQERFQYMWEILANGALGIIILVDNRRKDPISDLALYLDNFKRFIDNSTVVIGVTHSDLAARPGIDLYHDYLMSREMCFPVFQIDARSRADVVVLVESLVAMLEVA